MCPVTILYVISRRYNWHAVSCCNDTTADIGWTFRKRLWEDSGRFLFEFLNLSRRMNGGHEITLNLRIAGSVCSKNGGVKCDFVLILCSNTVERTPVYNTVSSYTSKKNSLTRSVFKKCVLIILLSICLYLQRFLVCITSFPVCNSTFSTDFICWFRIILRISSEYFLK